MEIKIVWIKYEQSIAKKCEQQNGNYQLLQTHLLCTFHFAQWEGKSKHFRWTILNEHVNPRWILNTPCRLHFCLFLSTTHHDVLVLFIHNFQSVWRDERKRQLWKTWSENFDRFPIQRIERKWYKHVLKTILILAVISLSQKRNLILLLSFR